MSKFIEKRSESAPMQIPTKTPDKQEQACSSYEYKFREHEISEYGNTPNKDKDKEYIFERFRYSNNMNDPNMPTGSTPPNKPDQTCSSYEFKVFEYEIPEYGTTPTKDKQYTFDRFRYSNNTKGPNMPLGTTPPNRTDIHKTYMDIYANMCLSKQEIGN